MFVAISSRWDGEPRALENAMVSVVLASDHNNLLLRCRRLSSPLSLRICFRLEQPHRRAHHVSLPNCR